ncbi:YkgJ family cysteine cluster protein [Reichenbachiella sp. MALMAid0571]|uniref:YkgJ family cysteine cluster protein n=1 Tax=Reichenbachiella sp. MALMAid0571 TaxID=3143939 RepID=UPI0032DEE017
MSIIRKVRSVERLFGRLELEITEFKAQTGLFCVSGCGKCCTKPDIDATPLEFLPYAFYLFLNGKAQETLETLEEEKSGICVIYNPLSVGDKVNGQCSEYPYRGLICRLFGYGASRDKLGELRLATCKIIKEGQAENYGKVAGLISQKMYVPVFSDYYMRLAQIDFKMGNAFLPINQALKRAIEEVLHYYAYRPFPRGMKTVA